VVTHLQYSFGPRSRPFRLLADGEDPPSLPLPLEDLIICLALSSVVLFAVELEKLLTRRGLIYSEEDPGEAR
jgi:hypothetical protein